MAVGCPREFGRGRLLPELVAARGVAAVWVALAHAAAMAAHGVAPLPEPIEYTRLVVDFFFVQSGFVLAHIYDADWREGRFRYRVFLARRLCRLWPLHVATLLAAACLVFAGRLVGLDPQSPHTPWTFSVTALMLHSAWLTDDLAWNWPSWSVSAEWCAYLAIPVYFLLADGVRTTLARVALALGAFVAAATFARLVLGEDLLTLTFAGGALRLAPSFLAGVLLRRSFDRESWLLAMTPRVYGGTLAFIGLAAATLVALHAPYEALWPLAVALVATLASRGSWDAAGLMRGRALAWLGELSYAIYMIHALVIQSLFSTAKLLGFGGDLRERAILAVLAVAGTALAAQIAYTLIERPGRILMARLLFGPRPQPALAGAGEGGATS